MSQSNDRIHVLYTPTLPLLTASLCSLGVLALALLQESLFVVLIMAASVVGLALSGST